jgi:hypothetical protein
VVGAAADSAPRDARNLNGHGLFQSVMSAAKDVRAVNNVRIQGHNFCFPVKELFLINGA